jgi:putative protease
MDVGGANQQIVSLTMRDRRQGPHRTGRDDHAPRCDELVSRLGGFAIHRVSAAEAAPYPTLCKGCFQAGDYKGHVFEDPVSLDAASLIPQLAEAGVTALKIEGRQRSRAYTEAVVRSFRRALDAYAAGRPIAAGELRELTEGQQTTSGAYRKAWR